MRRSRPLVDRTATLREKKAALKAYRESIGNLNDMPGLQYSLHGRITALEAEIAEDEKEPLRGP